MCSLNSFLILSIAFLSIRSGAGVPFCGSEEVIWSRSILPRPLRYFAVKSVSSKSFSCFDTADASMRKDISCVLRSFPLENSLSSRIRSDVVRDICIRISSFNFLPGDLGAENS